MQEVYPFEKIHAHYLKQTCEYADCDAPIVKVYKLWENDHHIYIRLECKAHHSDIFREGLARWS